MASLGTVTWQKAPGGSSGSAIIAGVDKIIITFTDIAIVSGYGITSSMLRVNNSTDTAGIVLLGASSGQVNLISASNDITIISQTATPSGDNYNAKSTVRYGPSTTLSAGINNFYFYLTNWGYASARATVTVTAHAYTVPVISSASALRCDSAGIETNEGQYIKARVDWTYAALGGANTSSASFSWAQEGSSMSPPVALTSGMWSAPQGGSVAPHRNYIVGITVSDAMGSNITRTLSISIVPPATPDLGEHWGLLSESRSGEDFKFEAPVEFNVVFFQPVEIFGLSFTFNVFDNSYCDDMSVQFVYENATQKTERLHPDKTDFYYDAYESDVSELKVLFYGMNKKDRFLWLQRFVFGRTYPFGNEEIVTHNILREMYLASEDLAINTLNFSLLLPHADAIPFNRRRQIRSYFKGQLQGVFFSDDVDRPSPHKWELRCVDALGVLDGISFDGDVYTNVLADALLQKIAEIPGIKIECETEIKGKHLSGWLPAGSCRQAVMQIAFAVGGIVDTTGSDKVFIRTIKNEVTSHITENRCKMGVPVKRDNVAVSEVRLSCWGYDKQTDVNSPGELTIVSGSGGAGSISFRENSGWDVVDSLPPLPVQENTKKVAKKVYSNQPYYSLGFKFWYFSLVHWANYPSDFYWIDANATTSSYPQMTSVYLSDILKLEGDSVNFSVGNNANYIEYTWGGNPISAFDAVPSSYFTNATHRAEIRARFLQRWPAGNVELLRIPYRISERVLTKTNPNLTPDERSSVLEYKKYTLVSDSNAQEILDLVFDMAMRNETVSATVILEDEKVGDMISIDTDFGTKTGVITSMDTNINNSKIAKIEVRV